MKLYINTAALSPAAATVTSEVVPEYVPPPVFVVGDTLDVEVYLVDGTGTFDSRSGDAAYDFRLGLGVIGDDPVALQDTWTPITNGWSAKFDLNTVEALALAAAASGKGVAVTLEADITDASTDRTTVLQADTTLRKELIEDGTPSPAPGEDFYNTEETDEKFVHNRYQVSALTGGGASSLDGIVTTGFTTGTLVAVVLSGVASLYKLTAGTDAESSPTVIRPDDYAATTNERVWKRVSMAGLGANPTASVGLTAVNGTADTYMRSDAAPALDQSITPNWTGIHLWTQDKDNEAIQVRPSGTEPVDNTTHLKSPYLTLRPKVWNGSNAVSEPFSLWGEGISGEDAFQGVLQANTTKVVLDSYGNVIAGVEGRTSTSRTGGFFYTPSGPGVPSGTPTKSFSWATPIYFDSTNNSLYAYNSGWQNLTSSGANPSASIGLTATNGVATTFMRSDAAPALNEAISPSWTGVHAFTGANIDTTWTEVISMQSSSVATAGNPEDSPAFSQYARIYDTTAGSATTALAMFKVAGQETAGRPNVTWKLQTTIGNSGGTRNSLSVKQNHGLRADVYACDVDGGATTSDTTGFLFIPSVAGVPTGVPANTVSGTVPIQYDTTNNKLYVYNGSWKSVTLS